MSPETNLIEELMELGDRSSNRPDQDEDSKKAGGDSKSSEQPDERSEEPEADEEQDIGGEEQEEEEVEGQEEEKETKPSSALMELFEKMNNLVAETTLKSDEKPSEQEPQKEDGSEQLISDEDIEQLTADRLNRALKKVKGEAVNAAAKKALSEVLPVVTKIVNDSVTLQLKVYDFYRENPEFVPIKPYVSFVAGKLAKENPGWNYDKLFKEVKKEVVADLKKLGMGKKKNISKPNFVKSTSQQRRQPDKEVDELQKELDELFPGR